MEVNPDRMQRSDHDTLIRVETKVDGLVEEIKTSNSNLSAQMFDHEIRIRSIEKVHDQVDPIGSAVKLNKLIADQTTTNAEKRQLAAISAGIASLITAAGMAVAALNGFLNLHK